MQVEQLEIWLESAEVRVFGHKGGTVGQRERGDEAVGHTQAVADQRRRIQDVGERGPTLLLLKPWLSWQACVD